MSNARVRVPRGRRGTAALLTALIAVLVLAWGAAEAIWLARHRRTFWFSVSDVARFGRRTELSHQVVMVVAIVVFAVGVLLLVSAVLPPRRRLVELAESSPSVATGITLRSLHRTLASAAVEVDGISSAKVTGRRRLTVRAATSLREVAALPELVQERVDARLRTLDPARARTVRIRLDRRDA